MKRATLVIVAFSIFSCLGLLFAQKTGQESRKLTLKVTSGNNERVSFKASIFFKTDKPHIDIVEQEVPYQVSIESDYVNATFVKTSGKGDLFVELLAPRPDDNAAALKASGSIVVVGTRNAEKRLYYQHTF